MCNQVDQVQPTGTFSLTQCRVPSVSGCSSTRPSPDWIVAQFEHVTTENSLEDVTTNVGLYGSCKENYMRLVCTRPTCESNGRLQGYRSAAQCNSVLDWYKPLVICCARYIAFSLLCISVCQTLPYKNRLKRRCSAATWTSFVSRALQPAEARPPAQVTVPPPTSGLLLHLCR